MIDEADEMEVMKGGQGAGRVCTVLERGGFARRLDVSAVRMIVVHWRPGSHRISLAFLSPKKKDAHAEVLS